MTNRVETVKISLARYSVLLAMRARKASGDQLVKINIALTLLVQAQAVAELSENEAKKLLALARNIGLQGAQSESKK